MSSVAAIGSPSARSLQAQGLPASIGEELALAVASADDFASGIERLAVMLRRYPGVSRVEWWAPADDGASFRLAVAAGADRGRRTAVPLGHAGALVVFGDERAATLVLTVARLAPLLRRLWTEEQLASRAALLAQQNEALEDFASLLAHDLKLSLLSALKSDDPRKSLVRGVEVVDSVLDLARVTATDDAVAPAARCLAQALDDLGDVPAEVVANLDVDLPMPAAALRLLMRNLVANAVAAGAQHIHVAALAAGAKRMFVVDDDGLGIQSNGYTKGTGLGVALCRRLVDRYDGVLELKPRGSGGTRVKIVLGRDR